MGFKKETKIQKISTIVYLILMLVINKNILCLKKNMF